jgi:hypothetical protein
MLAGFGHYNISGRSGLAHFMLKEDWSNSMTALYLLILAILAFNHHAHWSQLHPWTAWFVILVLAAIVDLVVHRSVF